MDFKYALNDLKEGRKVQRRGWNGKNMFLFLVSRWNFSLDAAPALDGDNESFSCPTLPFIAMKTADYCIVPWLASQTDMLATDWQVVL
jgi:hypothetical protein